MKQHSIHEAVRSGRMHLGCLALMSTVAACPLEVPESPLDPRADAVGLSLEIVNGQARPLVLQPGQRYYLDRLALKVRQDDFPVDDAMVWLAQNSAFAELDWGGIHPVFTRWSGAAGAWGRERGWGDAAWMQVAPSFLLERIDATGRVVGDPIRLRPDDYLFPRTTGVSWLEGAPAEGALGAHGQGRAVAATSGGSYLGPQDDVYTVEVETGGPLDGSARVQVRSVRGDDAAEALPLVAGVPLPLGSLGAELRFTALSGDALVQPGDGWLVRCSAELGVHPVELLPLARFHAVAELGLDRSLADVPVFALDPSVVALRIHAAGLATVQELAIEQAAGTDNRPGPGLEIELEVAPPRNGGSYSPGETVRVTVALRDRAGRLLHDPAQLPSYREFLQGRTAGLRYYGSSGQPCLPVFSSCDLTIPQLALAGPVDRITQNYTLDHPQGFHVEERWLPSSAIVFGGYANPALWDLPVPTELEFELPEDARPGSYVLIAKVARGAGGELVQRMVSRNLQVGGTTPTTWRSETGNCDLCHLGEARLQRLRHGSADSRLCVVCHGRPYLTAGQVVHAAHFYSPAYPTERNDCTVCHLSEGSNARVSEAVCSVCHGGIHSGEMELPADPFQQCGQSCHDSPPAGHTSWRSP